MNPTAHGILFRAVEVWGRGVSDCRVRGSRVVELASILAPRDDEVVIDGACGALLPGLADHHLHLTAMAAREASLDLEPVSRAELPAVIASARADAQGWIRAVGYDHRVHGELARDVLDKWRPHAPVRVQHRSGALWVTNSAALERLGAAVASHPGVEQDATERITGRLWRADDWLRRVIDSRPPSLGPIGKKLAAYGVTHVSDATEDFDGSAGQLIADAVRAGELPQQVAIMGERTPSVLPPRVTVGPVKIVVSDHEMPSFADLTDRIRNAHAQARPVAVHCVTQSALSLTLAALDDAGVRGDDRIEHCAVADLNVAHELADRGIRVVTQPTMLARRGDRYWSDVEPQERGNLWRYGELLRIGVRVAPSSDAPYGDADPWACLRAARDRRTPAGRVVGETERVTPPTALRGMLSHLAEPGGRPRMIRLGADADLVLLDRPLGEALSRPDAGCVRVTIIDGTIVYQR